MKWYEQNEMNNNIIISSRVRLARNIKKYPFYNFLNKQNSQEIINITKEAIFNSISNSNQYFDFIDMSKISDLDKIYMVENHTISLDFISNDMPKALILDKDEKISIMINEEDHIRIQSIEYGDNIEKAFENANKIDDFLSESIEYSFDEDLGYLTSCLTNVGTGMRISFMLHIPLLEKYKKIGSIAENISKFGMTIRGIYGEGTTSLAGIYQISNQATLGKTEEKILNDVKNITLQIVEKEKELRNIFKAENFLELNDIVYRAYGTLKYCKKISNDEALNYLSNIWLGIYYKILDIEKLNNINIYNIIMKIQPANLTKFYKELSTKEQLETFRANLINNTI